jgi:hypothetical protein
VLVGWPEAGRGTEQELALKTKGIILNEAKDPRDAHSSAPFQDHFYRPISHGLIFENH